MFEERVPNDDNSVAARWPHDRADDTPEDELGIALNLVIEDAEIAAILSEKTPGRERDGFALAALKIGVLALQQAGSRIDTDRIRNEGERLMESLGSALTTHREGMVADIARSLADYFDPNSGRLTQRVEKLVKEGGEIETVIRNQIAGDGSLLTKSMQEFLGENSPVIAMLDPQSDKGLAANLSRSVENTAHAQRDAILKEFSLDNPSGALSRTLRELTDKHDAAGATLEKKISTVVAEFSLDKEDSALSRLVARVDNAQKLLSDEFSLDKDGSALARMRKELTEQIAMLARTQNEFQTDIVSQLKEMAARKAESLKSTTHGLDFEAALFTHVQAIMQPRGDSVTATGNTTGLIANRKVGDIVIELGDEHVAARSKIVIEAKQNQSVDLPSARAEIETARKNRGADVGLFVYSSRSAPAGLAPLTRFGNDVFIIWDEDDQSTDMVLEAGLLLTSAMVVRQAVDLSEQTADFETIDKALLAVEKQIEHFDEVEKHCETIEKTSEKIRERNRKMRKAISRQMVLLDESVGAVKQSLGE